MVSWSSDDEVVRDLQVYRAYVYCVFGLYVWEVITTLHYDYKLLTGRIKFKWPSYLYFIGRYVTFATLSVTMYNIDVMDHPIDCQSTINAIPALVGIGVSAASGIFILRTVAIWRGARWVAVLLSLMWATNLALWMREIQASIEIFQPGFGCVVLKIRGWFLSPYASAEVVDGTTLFLAAYRFLIAHRGPGLTLFGLSKVLFRDGLSYFIVTFTVNTIQLIFVALNLNGVMAIMNSLLTLVLTVIMANRAVMSLTAAGLTPNYNTTAVWSRSKTGEHAYFPTERYQNVFNPDGLGGHNGVAITQTLERFESRREADDLEAEAASPLPHLTFPLASHAPSNHGDASTIRRSDVAHQFVHDDKPGRGEA